MNETVTIICKDCGAETPRKSPAQKYCPPCSSARDKLRTQKAFRRWYAKMTPEQRDRQRAAHLRWRANAPPEQKKRQAESCRRWRAACTARYAAGLLSRGTNLDADKIPSILAECKMLQLKIERYVKEAQK